MPRKRQNSKILPERLPTPKDDPGIGSIETTHKDWHSRVGSFFVNVGMVDADSAALAWAGAAPAKALRLNLVDGSSTGTGFLFTVPDDWANGPLKIEHYVSALTAPGFPAGETFIMETTSLEVVDSASVTAASAINTTVEYTPGTGYAELELYVTAAEEMITPTDTNAMIRVNFRRRGGDANDDFTDTLVWWGARITYSSDK